MYAGIDIGYNAVKVKCGEGQQFSFLSVVGTPDVSRFSIHGKNDSDVITIPGDGSWLIGKQAVEQSRIIQRREDRDWINSNEYYRLLLASMAKAAEINKLESDGRTIDLKVVTGLPVAFFGDKERLMSIYIGDHEVEVNGNMYEFNVTHCKVIPQPFGALLDESLDDNGEIANAMLAKGTVGIIDVGGKTTNLLSASKLSERARHTTSVTVGGWDIIRMFKERLTDSYAGLDLRDHEIAQAIIDNSLTYYGEKIDVSDMVQAVVVPFANQIVSEATQLWNGGASLDAVIVTGGGGILLFKYLSHEFRHAKLVKDPIFSNVSGYWKFAHRMKG